MWAGCRCASWLPSMVPKKHRSCFSDMVRSEPYFETSRGARTYVFVVVRYSDPSRPQSFGSDVEPTSSIRTSVLEEEDENCALVFEGQANGPLYIVGKISQRFLKMIRKPLGIMAFNFRQWHAVDFLGMIARDECWLPWILLVQPCGVYTRDTICRRLSRRGSE